MEKGRRATPVPGGGSSNEHQQGLPPAIIAVRARLAAENAAYEEAKARRISHMIPAKAPEPAPPSVPRLNRVVLAGTKLPITRQMRILVAGNAGVGKSTYVRRCCGEAFSTAVVPTIGVDFSQFCIADPTRPEKELLELSIWDVAGAERFDTITATYFRNLSGILFVCDIGSRESLDAVLWRWLPTAIYNLRGSMRKDDAPDKADVGAMKERYYQKGSATATDSLAAQACAEFRSFGLPAVLVGTKLDLYTTDGLKRGFAYEDAAQVAQQMGVPYVECSSKTDAQDTLSTPLAHVVHFTVSTPSLYKACRLDEKTIQSRLRARDAGVPSSTLNNGLRVLTTHRHRDNGDDDDGGGGPGDTGGSDGSSSSGCCA